ncbi:MULTISPECIES: NADPH-dependent FMN reductase [Martelella]|uniref:FMN-dependent NADPH-azoreductase n=1 Tax=Martelella mediterranea DSM 17316 TaxID=1122214 RepID=A0A1U9YXD8_9HYPH|nr:NAD(P)H-dependent oxidoreductase [Martelella mediterranea]AQZ50107.1 FMN-dependent NADPH-azoreductase [Martelella mediterranea DSM 17316]
MTRPKIGIIVGSTREGRFADHPLNWYLDIVKDRDDADFEVVDLRDYPMPFFEEKMSPAWVPPENDVARRWGEKLESLDGFVFTVAEYNHSITGVLKNALDYAYKEFNRKPATFLAYGGTGGARAVEQLRLILAELQVASLKYNVHIGMTELLGILREGKTMADFPYLIDGAKAMTDDLVWWTNALKTARAA